MYCIHFIPKIELIIGDIITYSWLCFSFCNVKQLFRTKCKTCLSSSCLWTVMGVPGKFDTDISSSALHWVWGWPLTPTAVPCWNGQVPRCSLTCSAAVTASNLVQKNLSINLFVIGRFRHLCLGSYCK